MKDVPFMGHAMNSNGSKGLWIYIYQMSEAIRTATPSYLKWPSFKQKGSKWIRDVLCKCTINLFDRDDSALQFQVLSFFQDKNFFQCLGSLGNKTI